jgi:hypothetical protein
MSFSTQKINNEVVKAVPLLQEKDTRPVRGAALFPELCSNIFLCARKQSGKTSAIYKIVKRCAGPKTKIMVFCSTIHKDSSWETIKAWALHKGIAFIGHTSLIDDEGTNTLKELIKSLQDDDDESSEVVRRQSIFESEEEDEPEKPAKYQSPEWIFILDDLADELKKPIIATFLKKNRHFKAKIIISTQYMNDLFPAARKQLDYVILFRGWSQKKIDEICKDVDVSLPKEEFYELYRFATEQPYSFLYVDVRGGTFRRNFNELIEVE